MICNKCNKEIENGTKFCMFCGAIQINSQKKEPKVIEVSPVVKKNEEKQDEKAVKNVENATLTASECEDGIEKIEKISKAKKQKVTKEKKEAKEKPAFKKEEKPAKKSADRVNFFLLLLSLLCPPYFGVLITIWQSAKAPKSSQVYGVATILSFIFVKVKNYVLTVLATLSVVILVLTSVLSGAYIVLTELGYDLSFVTDFVSSIL